LYRCEGTSWEGNGKASPIKIPPTWKEDVMTLKLISSGRRRGSFTWYLICQFVSAMGTAVQLTAVILAAIKHQQGGLLTILLCNSAGALIALALNSARGDRFPPRSIMIAALAGQMIIALLLGWLQATEALSLWAMDGLQLVAGALDGVYRPAESAMVKDLVREGKEAFFQAQLINVTCLQMAAGVSAILALFFLDPRFRWIFYLANASSYVGALTFVFVTRHGRTWSLGRTLTGKPAWNEAWEHVVNRFSGLWVLLAYIAWFAFMMKGQVFTPEAGTSLFGGARGYLWLAIATAVGNVLAPLVLGWLMRRVNAYPSVKNLFIGGLWGAFWFTLYGAAFNLTSSVVFIVLGIFGAEAVLSFASPLLTQGDRKEDVPAHLHQRIESIRGLAGTLGQMVANVLAFAGISLFGVRATGVWLSVIGLVLLAALGASATRSWFDRLARLPLTLSEENIAEALEIYKKRSRPRPELLLAALQATAPTQITHGLLVITLERLEEQQATVGPDYTLAILAALPRENEELVGRVLRVLSRSILVLEALASLPPSPERENLIERVELFSREVGPIPPLEEQWAILYVVFQQRTMPSPQKALEGMTKAILRAAHSRVAEAHSRAAEAHSRAAEAHSRAVLKLALASTLLFALLMSLGMVVPTDLYVIRSHGPVWIMPLTGSSAVVILHTLRIWRWLKKQNRRLYTAHHRQPSASRADGGGSPKLLCFHRQWFHETNYYKNNPLFANISPTFFISYFIWTSYIHDYHTTVIAYE
jgi:MFS family permease